MNISDKQGVNLHMKRFLLGVDGGNTKTDYLLCTTEGDFVDVLRTGTCSHEAVPGGYDGMEEAMTRQLNQLFDRNGITIKDIAAAGFGLAGADLPSQIEELCARVEKIGFTNYGLNNDGILGIKGALTSGIGLCAVNGTGTVVLGADEKGQALQVGGIGYLSGDYAGGSHIFRQIIEKMHDYYFRCGPESMMFPKVLELLEAMPEDIPVLINENSRLRKNTAEIIQIGSNAAVTGDAVAQGIFDAVGASIAHSVAGCVRRLSFEGMGTADNPIEIALVGSIWEKVGYTGMLKTFMKTAQDLSGKHFKTMSIQAPPAVGGVLWAKAIESGAPPTPEYRRKVLEAISLEKYEALVLECPHAL